MTTRGTRYWSSGAIPLIAPELLGDIIAAASDLAVVVTPEGRVLSVLVGRQGADAPEMGRGPGIGPLDHWEGADLRRHLTPESVPKLDGALGAMTEGRAVLRPVELNHTDAAAPDLPVRYSFHPIGPGGAVLMLGRDLRPVAEMQQRLVRAQLALERDYEEGRALETRYRALLASTREPVVFAALATGRIADLNDPAARLLGGRVQDLAGSSLAQELDGRRRGELMEALVEPAPVDVRSRRSGAALRLRSMPFRSGGERFALIRLEAPAAAAAEGGLSEALEGLFRGGAEAIVFTDAQGVVRQANDAFLGLVDAADPTAVLGRGLAEHLARGSADLRVLTEAAARSGALRLYATGIVTAFGGRVGVEVSVTALGDGGAENAPDGFAFVFRDAERAGAVQGEVAIGERALAQGAGRSIADLVGGAPLRDIVAETTDAVERLCIRTAVELTGNNRVAAAEMLGLSRQSLYVKLRKYGLLSREGDE